MWYKHFVECKLHLLAMSIIIVLFISSNMEPTIQRMPPTTQVVGSVGEGQQRHTARNDRNRREINLRGIKCVYLHYIFAQ